MSELIDLIQQIALDAMPDRSVEGTVEAVDRVLATCTVQPLDADAPLLYGIRLQAQAGNGQLLIPVIGSRVMVALLTDAEGYVALFSKIQEMETTVVGDVSLTAGGVIAYNKGLNGGVPLSLAIMARFNEDALEISLLKAAVFELQTKLALFFSIPGNNPVSDAAGVTPTLIPVLFVDPAPTPPAIQTQFEDPKFTH